MKEWRKRHLIQNLLWGDGCRCCYDPNSDGGEYRALVEFREQLKSNEESEESEEEEAQKEQQQQESDSTTDSDEDDEFDYLLDEDLPGNDGIYELEERCRA